MLVSINSEPRRQGITNENKGTNRKRERNGISTTIPEKKANQSALRGTTIEKEQVHIRKWSWQSPIGCSKSLKFIFQTTKSHFISELTTINTLYNNNNKVPLSLQQRNLVDFGLFTRLCHNHSWRYRPRLDNFLPGTSNRSLQFFDKSKTTVPGQPFSSRPHNSQPARHLGDARRDPGQRWWPRCKQRFRSQWLGWHSVPLGESEQRHGCCVSTRHRYSLLSVTVWKHSCCRKRRLHHRDWRWTR